MNKVTLTSEEQKYINERFEGKLRTLTYNEDNPETKFTRFGDAYLYEDGKIGGSVKKFTRIHRWIDVCTYHRENDKVYGFLWRLIRWLDKDDNDPEYVDVKLSPKKDRIEVKLTYASKSRIVGKLPDDIYNQIKDRDDLEYLEARFDFFAEDYEPGSLNISIYQHNYSVIKFDNWKYI